MAEFRYVICDVFTDRPLEGNPLAVFTDARAIPDTLLQPLARELHLSETVFCYPARGTGHVRIRIFTPAHELPFAGHPVLGSAFVLAASLQLPEIVLETGVGPVPVRLERDGPRIVFGRMTQPVPRIETVPDPAALLRALGVERAALPVELYDNGPRHVFVGLGSEAEVAALQPDFQALARLFPRGTTNCFAGAGRRWKTRAFRRAPACPRTQPPAPPPGRSPATSRGTGGSPSARRSRSARAPRSTGRASSSPASTASPTGSSGSRSVAPPSRWRAASSGWWSEISRAAGDGSGRARR